MPKEYKPDSYGEAMQKEANELLQSIRSMQELLEEGAEPGEVGYEQKRKDAQKSFTRLLLYHQESLEYGIDTQFYGTSKHFVDTQAQEHENDPKIKALFAPENLSNLEKMMTDKDKELLPVDRMIENFQASVVKTDDQKEQFKKGIEETRLREKRQEITEKLSGTLSKSFAGRIKSFFVGNSKEYDRAFNSLSALAAGEGDARAAEENIKQYLTLRGKKVRDHEYGRERFEYMMQGLATVMDPMKFEQFCAGIDQDRRELSKGAYKGTIDATQYMTDAQKEQLAAQKQAAEQKLEDKETRNDFSKKKTPEEYDRQAAEESKQAEENLLEFLQG